MAEAELGGWIKVYRRILRSPLWLRASDPCRLLFVWLLASARPWPKTVCRHGREYPLERGEVFASIADAAAGARITPKAARHGFAWLERESMIVRDESLVMIVNYHLYQGDVDDLGEEGEEGAENNSENEGHDLGQGKGQGENVKRGKASTPDNRLSRKDDVVTEKSSGARQKRCKGQGKGQGLGQGKRSSFDGQTSPLPLRARAPAKLAVEEKRINNPPTPFCKGGRLSLNSEEILAMWREERSAAGLGCFESKRSRRAAGEIAEEWLGQARMTVQQLRLGMRAIVAASKSDPKCRQYDLATFAKNPDPWTPPPPIMKAKRRYARWTYECDVCGRLFVGDPGPADAPEPKAEECGGTYKNPCQGWMQPVKREEIER